MMKSQSWKNDDELQSENWNVQKFYLGWTNGFLNNRVDIQPKLLSTVSCKLLILNPEIKVDYLFKGIVELKLKQ